jgi:hypothetical protein
MLKEDFPCFKCLKRPVCQNEERIECSDLFFIILNTADFDRSNKVMNGIIKNVLKQILFNVTHIVPEKDWKERLPYENDTM